MLRRQRPILLAMLLILAGALTLLWTRSYFSYDLAGRGGAHGVALGSYRGHLLLFYWRNDSSEAVWGYIRGPTTEAESVWEEINKSATFRLLGFGLAHSDDAATRGLSNAIFVPDWFMMLLVGWPAFQMTRSVLSTRRRSWGYASSAATTCEPRQTVARNAARSSGNRRDQVRNNADDRIFIDVRKPPDILLRAA